MKKARDFVQLGSLKKISTIIGILGVIIGVILGSYQISQEILKAKEIQKEVQIQLLIGDSFSERQEYTRAIEEYEKALSFDKDNIEAHRRIITASTKKFALQRTKGSEVESQDVDDVLVKIHRVYALNPSLKEDIGLLLEEALILKEANRLRASISVLEKAHNLSPKNPDVLAELGYLSSSKENIEALDLIRRAIEIEPNNPRYHFYLADAEEKAALYAEAIRDYNRTAMLAMLAFDDYNKSLRDYSSGKLQKIFIEYGLNEESLLDSELDMPLEERAQIIEYWLEYWREKGLEEEEFLYMGIYQTEKSYMYLARTYYELGDLKKATATIRSLLDWSSKDDFLILYAMFLEEGNLDSSTLKEVYDNIGNLPVDCDLRLFSSRHSFPWKHAHDYFIKYCEKRHGR